MRSLFVATTSKELQSRDVVFKWMCIPVDLKSTKSKNLKKRNESSCDKTGPELIKVFNDGVVEKVFAEIYLGDVLLGTTNSVEIHNYQTPATYRITIDNPNYDCPFHTCHRSSIGRYFNGSMVTNFGSSMFETIIEKKDVSCPNNSVVEAWTFYGVMDSTGSSFVATSPGELQMMSCR